MQNRRKINLTEIYEEKGLILTSMSLGKNYNNFHFIKIFSLGTSLFFSPFCFDLLKILILNDIKLIKRDEALFVAPFNRNLPKVLPIRLKLKFTARIKCFHNLFFTWSLYLNTPHTFIISFLSRPL